jgi:signal transduction histidine kinase
VKEQIKQVLLNIVINAVEGLSNVHKSKVITIDLTVENEEVHVSICNNGPKIPDHLLENIFEPFITTKDLGFGLGLSVCKQIVQKHNGSINVQSDIERTTFKIVLPITK